MFDALDVHLTWSERTHNDDGDVNFHMHMSEIHGNVCETCFCTSNVVLLCVCVQIINIFVSDATTTTLESQTNAPDRMRPGEKVANVRVLHIMHV